jgi:hypothetical protein
MQALKKTTAWKHFSMFIRLRDCKRTTRTLTHASCVSCGKIKPLAELDAGHFIAAIHRRVFWDEHNVNAQCKHCNTYLSGNQLPYRKRLLSLYGPEEVERLENSTGGYVKYSDEELKAIAKIYRLKVKELKANDSQR